MAYTRKPISAASDDPEVKKLASKIDDEFKKIGSLSLIPSKPPAGCRVVINMYVDGAGNLVFEYEA